MADLIKACGNNCNSQIFWCNVKTFYKKINSLFDSKFYQNIFQRVYVRGARAGSL